MGTPIELEVNFLVTGIYFNTLRVTPGMGHWTMEH